MDMQYNYTAGQNNGRIASSQDYISGETVQYAYDGLLRLASAQTTGTQWGEAYTYDGFGNLTGKTPTKGSAPALSVSYNPATNQPYNGNYDANGNAPVGTWNVENKLVGQVLDGTQVNWSYDPFGERVVRYTSSGSWWSESSSCASEGTDVYFGGKLIAETDASGQVLAPTDRLGTVRGVNTNGTIAQPTYFPYGEPKTAGGIDRQQQFGTYVRDSTPSAQDYAGQRYYSNVTGRFFSPDPGGIATADPMDPGSWNRYAYVQGDPVNHQDRSGLFLSAQSCINDADACGAEDWGLWIGLPGGNGAGVAGGGNPCSNAWLAYAFNEGIASGCYDTNAGQASRSAPQAKYFLTVRPGTDCYRVPASGAVTREVTYELDVLEPGMPRPMFTNQGGIWEHLLGLGSSAGSNSPSSGPPGTYEDQQSIAGVGTGNQVGTQVFTAQLTSGISVGLGIAAFGGTVSNPVFQLNIQKHAGYVSINGDIGGKIDGSGKLIPGTYKSCD